MRLQTCVVKTIENHTGTLIEETASQVSRKSMNLITNGNMPNGHCKFFRVPIHILKIPSSCSLLQYESRHSIYLISQPPPPRGIISKVVDERQDVKKQEAGPGMEQPHEKRTPKGGPGRAEESHFRCPGAVQRVGILCTLIDRQHVEIKVPVTFCYLE